MKRKIFGCFLVLSLIQASISYAQQETVAQGSDQSKIINTQLQAIKSQVNQQDVSKQGLSTEFKSLIINPVVVTATKFPTQMDKTGDVIRVITKTELDNLGVKSLSEALGLISNVSIAKSGGLDTLFMRGLHSGSTKVLLNGIELNDPISTNGQPMINSLAFSAVERIEIVSGAKGTIQGAASQAGVINIITQKNTNGVFANAEYAGTDYILNGSFGTSIENISINFDVFYETDNSESLLVNTTEIDKKTLQSIAFSINNQLSASTKISTFYTFNKLNQDLDNSTTDDLNYVVDSDQHLGSIQYNWILSPKVQSNFGYTKTFTKRDYTNTPDSAADVNERDASYESNIDKVFINTQYKLNAKNNFVYGVDLTSETGKFVDNGASSWGPYQSNQGSKDQIQASTFGQYYNENKLLSSKIGSRLIKYGDDKLIATYAVSLFRQIPFIDTTALVNFRTGYRPGSLYERFNSSAGNNQLDAETSLTTEYSLLKTFAFTQLKVSYFKNFIDNSIEYNNSTFKYYNSDEKTNTSGLELSIQTNPFKAIEFLRLDVASLDAKTSTGQKLLRRPEYKASVSTGVRYMNTTFGLSLIATGDRVDIDPATSSRVDMPSFIIANLKVNYNLNDNSDVYFKLYNVTNTQYESTKGYNGLNRQFYLGYEKRF